MKLNSPTFKTRLSLAIGVAIVGILVAWRGLSRSLPQPLPSSSGSSSVANAASPSSTPASAVDWTETRWGVLLTASQMTFEVHPTEKSLPRVINEAGQHLQELAYGLRESEAAIEPARINLLRERFERHLQIILSASYDEWLKQINELRGSFTAPPGEEGGQPAREQWIKQAGAFLLAPLSIDSMSIRPLYLHGEKIEYPDPPVWGTAIYRGPYGAPDDPAAAKVDVYEALVPMQMHVGPAGRDKRMNVGFSYFWSDDRQTWIPFNMQVYTDDGGTFRMFAF